MSARTATAAMFVVNGAVVGSWVAQIPYIQERFDLSNGTLGLVILGVACGAILGTLVAGQAIARAGSLRVLRVAAPACAALLALPLLAPTPALTTAGLLALGLASGAMDVSMNSQGVADEQDRGWPIMSSLHAGWSLGGLLGSVSVALATAAEVEPRLQLAVAAVILVGVAVALGRWLGRGSTGAGTAAPFIVLPSRGVLVLAVLCLLIMVMEGAMGDWSGVYLRQETGSAASVAALGFAAMSAGMLVGRVFGDAVNRRIGAVRLLRGGALLAGVALAGFLLVGEPAATLIGVALVGLGVANGVPLLFSSAGRTGEDQSGPGIAAVSSLGSLGFLAGPPLIGLTADVIGLPVTLATLCVAMGAVVLASDSAA